MDNYRNPNEAIKFLQKIRQAMEKISSMNVVSITTASTTRTKTRVINLSDLPMPASASQEVKRASSKSKPNITRTGDMLSIRADRLEDGEFQHLAKLDKEYRHTIQLYRDLKDKSVEWNTLWADNPHLDKLKAELVVTLESIEEALTTIRRKMSETTKRYCPQKVLAIVADIEDYLKSMPAKRFAKSIEVSYPDDQNGLLMKYRFAYKLSSLKTHSTKVIPQYIVAITYIVDLEKQAAIGHIATMMEFDPNADIGGSFKTVEQGIDLINTLLDLDRIDIDINVLPFPEIPGLNKDNLGLEMVASMDTDPDLHRLFVRTTEFLNDEDADEVLRKVLAFMPDHLKHGGLRVDMGVEAFVLVSPVTDRKKRAEIFDKLNGAFDNVSLRNVGPNSSSDLELYIKTNSFKVANKELPAFKRFVTSKCGLTPKTSKIRNVFSFAVGAGKRSDIRELRKFIDMAANELDPSSVMKIRKALGV